VLALWLTALGVRVRIIDKAPQPGTTSRALAVQSRTLELYRQLGLADEVISRGHKVPGVNFWVKGSPVARVPFLNIGSGLTPFPFMTIFPQDQHESLLIERLASRGVSVERPVELLDFTERPDGVTARVRAPSGEEQSLQAAFIAGCDGARSQVRETLGSGFPGGTYRQVFYVADVDATGPAVDGELHLDLDEADFLAVFPLAGQGRARLVGTVRDERAAAAESLRFDDVGNRAIEHLKVAITRVNWFSAYHVHHRVSAHFRKGRAFLLGDAAHIHSPAGGQGMNTGIGDAINLAWKLAAVLAGHGPESLLDSFEAERIGFARRLVATTDRAFTFATAGGRLADVVRTRIAPILMPAVMRIDSAREFLFRTVAQLALNYRDGPLSSGSAGEVHGGDRLPWVSLDGSDNHSTLDCMQWQVHVYGAATDGLVTWCADRKVPLHVYEWRSEFDGVGFQRNGLYLLRPDSYVARASASCTPQILDRYFSERGLSSAAAGSG
jgi:2-polyprenyl-6-methoxyphenol hydroxylase-like FAD-dependent oxidoreductase